MLAVSLAPAAVTAPTTPRPRAPHTRSERSAARSRRAVASHLLLTSTAEWVRDWRAREGIAPESGAAVAHRLVVANRAWLKQTLADPAALRLIEAYLLGLARGLPVAPLPDVEWTHGPLMTSSPLPDLVSILRRESIFTVGPALATWMEQLLLAAANPALAVRAFWEQIGRDHLGTQLPLWAQIRDADLLERARQLQQIEQALRTWARTGDRQALRPLLLSPDRTWRTHALRWLADAAA